MITSARAIDNYTVLIDCIDFELVVKRDAVTNVWADCESINENNEGDYHYYISIEYILETFEIAYQKDYNLLSTFFYTRQPIIEEVESIETRLITNAIMELEI